MIREIEVGDEFVVPEGICSSGQKVRVIRIEINSDGEPVIHYNNGDNCYSREHLESIRKILGVKNNKNMNIKESFTLAFKKEPEKSFRKTGITNGDDFLTEDGMKIFLSWLLNKHGIEFKKEVVDGLLAEQEKTK